MNGALRVGGQERQERICVLECLGSKPDLLMPRQLTRRGLLDLVTTGGGA